MLTVSLSAESSGEYTGMARTKRTRVAISVHVVMTISAVSHQRPRCKSQRVLVAGLGATAGLTGCVSWEDAETLLMA